MPSKNRSQPKVVDDGLVDLDAAKLDRACVAAGMSLRDLATQSDVAWNTLRKLAAGEGVFPHVAHKVAVTLKRDVLSLLAERDPRYEPPLAQLAAADWEWELDDYLDPGGVPRAGCITSSAECGIDTWPDDSDAASSMRCPVSRNVSETRSGCTC